MECPNISDSPTRWVESEESIIKSLILSTEVDYFLKCYDMPNYFIVLNRRYHYNGGICGSLYLFDCDKTTIVFRCDTLEHSTKFIPQGDYPVEVNYSPRFGEDLPLVLGVPDRDGIRIHSGNYEKDTTGCILVGKQTFNTSTLYDSRKTLELLLSYIKYAENIRLLIV